MVKMKTLIVAAAVLGLTLGLAGMASAATITCGGCHGLTTKTPAYESAALPTNADNCDNTGRGLHGTHGNYSSASYAMSSYGTRGTCSYCHTSSGGGHPTVTHNNNYTNITGNTASGRQTYDTRGLDYDSATSTCTSACHKNRAQTAKWGNYTATTAGGIKLNCRSCHDDVVDKTGLSGAHAPHLNSAIDTGGTAMGAANNAGCVNCHPDNVNDLWSGGKADDGTKRAYPHASDGTNVASDNAGLSAGIGANRGAGSTDTCATSCHPRSSTKQWGATMDCDMCHYYEASPSSANNTGTGALSGAHNSHFDNGIACSNCHGTDPADTSHVTALPAVSDSVTLTRTGMTANRGAGNTDTCTFGSAGAGNGCHGDGNTSPQWGSTNNGCTTCHNYPGGDGLGGKDWAAGNGHNVKYATSSATNSHLRDNASYNKLTDTVASVTADVDKCGRCHTSAATHNNGAINVSANGAGNCGGNFTINVTTTRVTVSCDSVKCHSGKTTPNWW